MRVLWLTYWAMVVTGVASMVVVVLLVYFVDRSPVITDVRFEPINSPVLFQQPLFVRISRTKLRTECTPLTSVRQATNLDTGQVEDIPDQVWAGGSPDEAYVDILFDTTRLAPGNYQGQVITTYPCPYWTFTYRGDFFFKVVSRRTQNDKLQHRIDGSRGGVSRSRRVAGR